MAIESLECDPSIWSDQSFFNVDHQTQQCCDISSKLGSETEWGEDMKQFWESFELDFNNEPDFDVEVMSKEVDSKVHTSKCEPDLDITYLNASVFLSPISTAPSSPALPTNDYFEQQLEVSSDVSYINGIPGPSVDEDLDNTSAMDILDKILSANSSDNEDLHEECFDSAVNAVQYFSSAVTQSDIIETQLVANNAITVGRNESNTKKKRQTKRKSAEVDSESRVIKRSKRSNPSVVDKKERKKSQNKSAANRYRIKKRIEQESIDVLQTEQLKINEKLKAELGKLQMEFKVVYPLAKTAFASDPKRNLLLQLLNMRVLKDNLMD